MSQSLSRVLLMLIFSTALICHPLAQETILGSLDVEVLEVCDFNDGTRYVVCVHGDQQPVPGARVIVRSSSADFYEEKQTFLNGTASFTVPLPADPTKSFTYVVVVTKYETTLVNGQPEKYNFSRFTMAISQGSTQPVLMPLVPDPRAISIRGKVIDQDTKESIQDVLVTAVAVQQLYSIKTPADGSYRLDSLPGGTGFTLHATGIPTTVQASVRSSNQQTGRS